MKPALRTLAFVLQFAVLGLAIAFVVTRLWPDVPARLRGQAEPMPAPLPAAAPAPAGAGLGSGPVSYADAVARAAPAVVNIYANKVIASQRRLISVDPVTQRMFGGVSVGPPAYRREQSLGSGVIVSADGYVLTNNHVIARSNDIQVLLYDGRIATARLVGGDEDTDLAVLKIEASDLPSMKLDEAPPVNVGDVVLAIGNPIGLGKTVTMGIASAIDRQLDQWAYEDFIQTDAAINSGNSGGALVNARGELVGINTANVPQRQIAEGIGFAIPVATAKGVLDQIVEKGMVVRGWLGVEYGRMPIQADANLASMARGAQVLAIYPQSPAARAGLQVGDVLLSFNGEEIDDPLELRKREAALAPGTRVHVTGLRAGIAFEADAELIQRPVLNRGVPIPTG
ncbi:S1C family serine protease [Tahibacter harae]|uniref:Trypsin-like peptidase domain-containing protein n=1 Tax=Tahibacter harae TaxID=2963937 RepID=A0ABT1QSE4_9GAMM|nr:trypsin-like peptidase domain-containing protein [Tahibacter harae]MCQ4165177.1 trypsin-like peptidase domain-containing protein [Tahibacter harae]